MVRGRQPAGQFPLSLPILLITVLPFLLIELVNGQPNYYFKASAPAVKSLPRIGRRSEQDSGNTGEVVFPSPSGSRGGGGDLLEMWSNPVESYGVNAGLSRGSGSGGLAASSLIPPSSAQQLDKTILWRKLMGDINNYEEALLDNLYRSKS